MLITWDLSGCTVGKASEGGLWWCWVKQKWEHDENINYSLCILILGYFIDFWMEITNNTLEIQSDSNNLPLKYSKFLLFFIKKELTLKYNNQLTVSRSGKFNHIGYIKPDADLVNNRIVIQRVRWLRFEWYSNVTRGLWSLIWKYGNLESGALETNTSFSLRKDKSLK